MKRSSIVALALLGSWSALIGHSCYSSFNRDNYTTTQPSSTGGAAIGRAYRGGGRGSHATDTTTRGGFGSGGSRSVGG